MTTDLITVVALCSGRISIVTSVDLILFFIAEIAFLTSFSFVKILEIVFYCYHIDQVVNKN